MCEKGDTIDVEIAGAMVPVDACIAEEVRMLNSRGVHTYCSCCGHEEQRGQITFRPGDIERAVRLGYNVETHMTRPVWVVEDDERLRHVRGTWSAIIWLGDLRLPYPRPRKVSRAC